jgi:hypothetical protein
MAYTGRYACLTAFPKERILLFIDLFIDLFTSQSDPSIALSSASGK